MQQRFLLISVFVVLHMQVQGMQKVLTRTHQQKIVHEEPFNQHVALQPLVDEQSQSALATLLLFKELKVDKTKAVSPDGKLLAAVDNDDEGTILLGDVDKDEVLHALEGHSGPVRIIAWSEDSSRIASSASDGTNYLWDVATGECLAVFEAEGSSVELDDVSDAKSYYEQIMASPHHKVAIITTILAIAGELLYRFAKWA